MSQTSANHPLDTSDPADLPRCPMERLADRFMDVPKPTWLDRYATRTASGHCMAYLEAEFTNPDQIEDLINFLARVKG